MYSKRFIKTKATLTCKFVTLKVVEAKADVAKIGTTGKGGWNLAIKSVEAQIKMVETPKKAELMGNRTMQLILGKVEAPQEGEICYCGREGTREVEPRKLKCCDAPTLLPTSTTRHTKPLAVTGC